MNYDAEEFFSFAMLAVAAALSYELPIYAARLVGQEDQLNQLWRVAWNDGIGSRLVMLGGWLTVGFLMWLLPVVALFKIGSGLLRRFRMRDFHDVGGGDGEPWSQEPPRPEPKPSVGPCRDELALLGLPVNCTEADLKSRYRKLAKQVHPDIIGENDIFRRLTEARNAIATARGWSI